jgi:hypothetical protein
MSKLSHVRLAKKGRRTSVPVIRNSDGHYIMYFYNENGTNQKKKKINKMSMLNTV